MHTYMHARLPAYILHPYMHTWIDGWMDRSIDADWIVKCMNA